MITIDKVDKLQGVKQIGLNYLNKLSKAIPSYTMEAFLNMLQSIKQRLLTLKF